LWRNLFQRAPAPADAGGSTNVRDQLNQLDLAFVIDTTGSMGPFIDTARQHVTDLLRALTKNATSQIDLSVGLVEYRDHPPQDHTFVTREHPFTGDLDQVQQAIDGLRPDGGGDVPEAVYDGLRAAGDVLAWRLHSRRVAILIGDAPPHGWVARLGDPQRACACGLTADSASALLENKKIVLYALGLTGGVDASFGRLARATGGTYLAAYRGQDALAATQAILDQEFADLDFDRRVLDALTADATRSVDDLSGLLEAQPRRVAASLGRLGRRGFLSSRPLAAAVDTEGVAVEQSRVGVHAHVSRDAMRLVQAFYRHPA
jgi:hypothetical protein